MPAKDGKMRETDCTDTKGISRVIQAIPSPKAESFKLWLAQGGNERLEEIVNLELAINRAKETYIKKGYDNGWIAQRLKLIDSIIMMMKIQFNYRGTAFHRPNFILFFFHKILIPSNKKQ